MADAPSGSIRELATRAKNASRRLLALDRAAKDRALAAIAEGLRAQSAELFSANELDLAADFGDWKLRPGMSLRLPLDEDLSDSIAAVYGLSLSYAP